MHFLVATVDGNFLFLVVLQRLNMAHSLDAKNLAKVMLPNGVTTIGRNAFAYCSNLTNIIIPGRGYFD